MWSFKGQPFTSEQLAQYKGAFGFVYLIECEGLLYVGQKLFYGTKTVTKNKVAKKVKCESDWKSYVSSSEIIKEKVKSGAAIKKTILYITSCKGQSNYIETRLQMDLRVLEQPQVFLNKIMNFRCHHTHVKLHTLVDCDEVTVNDLKSRYSPSN